MKNLFINALLSEIDDRYLFLDSQKISTIYFGGGTPSVLDSKEIKLILARISNNFELNANLEITLEANPDDLTSQKLIELKSAGINRLSIGVQSFAEDVLKWMNRSHSADQSTQCILNARAAGFDNVSIDMIYGNPGKDQLFWKNDLETALSFDLEHYSSYALTVENKTALHHKIKMGEESAPDEEIQQLNFMHLLQRMSQAGFEHYETSNFAKKGFRSEHNSSYWSGKHYLGLGPSAHSYDGKNRYWNVSNNKKYIDAIANSSSYTSMEELSEKDRFNEWLMISLRTVEGCTKNRLAEFDDQFKSAFLRSVRKAVENGMVIETNDTFKCSEKGKFYADGIASDLFAL